MRNSPLFGTELRSLMDKEQKSLRSLAFESGVTKSHLQLILKAERSVTEESAGRLLDVLGIKGAEREYLLNLAALTKLPRDVPEARVRALEGLVMSARRARKR